MTSHKYNFSNSAIIYIDWDDTLFPTSWYLKNNININLINEPHIIEIFSNIDDIICDFLEWIQKFGDIIIVSNASKKWIDQSMSSLKKTKNILDNIEIISARDIYEYYSNCPIDWKAFVFKNCASKYKNPTNIISIGDSEHERIAIHSLQDAIKCKKNIKSIKFISNPCVENMSDQINILKNMMDSICDIDMDIDIDMDCYMDLIVV